MKIIALLAAGLLAAGGLAAAPAEAQRQGYDGYRDGPRYGHDRGRRGDRWQRGRGYGRGYGYGRQSRFRNRGRVVCRVRPGRYGPVRTCYRVRR